MDIQLEEKELLGLGGDARGLEIRCREGRLWVTQAGDGRDHLLGPGDCFAVTTRGRVVIVPLKDVRLALAHAACGVPAKRWRLDSLCCR